LPVPAEYAAGHTAGYAAGYAVGQRSAHALVYFLDHGTPLDDELSDIRKGRVARNISVVESLNRHGVGISYAEVVAEAGNEETAGRPHIASVMMYKGYVQSIPEAFGQWLGYGCPAYVPRISLDAEQLARLASDSGSLVVLAHPLRIGLSRDELDALTGYLSGIGFSGLEAYYSTYTLGERASLAKLAAGYGMVATGGSDFHGTYKPGISAGTGTGDLDVPDSVAERLIAHHEQLA
jgi:predicted metal-dependent phosphoesterase TrpH